ncbi:MAG: nucleotide excision repair endonuclease, partial [Clostridia bacterium]|nr:nucleotide excision repair endonuclease [Clostridia bacterium]
MNTPSRKRDLAALRKKASSLPRSPGVYIMRDAAGKVIYVGKSRSLRDRVSQYFHGTHDVKTERMASSVCDFSFITCDTEMEA